MCVTNQNLHLDAGLEDPSSQPASRSICVYLCLWFDVPWLQKDLLQAANTVYSHGFPSHPTEGKHTLEGFSFNLQKPSTSVRLGLVTKASKARDSDHSVSEGRFDFP